MATVIYELREYVAADGASERLHARFRDHVLGLFDRHGMKVVGFWCGSDDRGTITYLLRFSDVAHRDAAWKAFRDDPEWQRVKVDSERRGSLTESKTSRILVDPGYGPDTV